MNNFQRGDKLLYIGEQKVENSRTLYRDKDFLSTFIEYTQGGGVTIQDYKGNIKRGMSEDIFKIANLIQENE